MEGIVGLLLLMLWVFMGLISAAIGRSKGGSAFGWLILGLLFGPLAWLFAAVKVPASSEHFGPNRKCPHCAELVKLEAVICKHCQRDIASATAEQPAPRKMPLHNPWND